MPLSEAVNRVLVSSKLVVSAVDPGSRGIRSVGKPSAMAPEVVVADGVAVLPAEADGLPVAEGEEEADPLAEGEEVAADGEAEAEDVPDPASVVSESEVQPAAVKSRAAAVRAVMSFFMGIRIWWGVRIWSPV